MEKKVERLFEVKRLKRALLGLSDRTGSDCHFGPFRARKNAFLCLRVRYRVLTTSAPGGAKVDMSPIHANYGPLAPARPTPLRRRARPSTTKIGFEFLGAAWRHVVDSFFFFFFK